MNATQQQLHIINSLLDGALLECYWIFCSFVLLSFLKHVKSLLKHDIRQVPLSDITYDTDLVKQVLQDQITKAQEVVELVEEQVNCNSRDYSTDVIAALYSIRELKAIARNGKVKRYSSMTKIQLAETLLDHKLIY